MSDDPELIPVISPADMQVVERVLNMKGGYVLDFSNKTFDEFIAHEVGVDATAPRFSKDGGSKARRLRRIIPSLPAKQQANLLRAFLKYRDGPVYTGEPKLLDDEWRRAYGDIIDALDRQVADADAVYASSQWTGRRTVREQVTILRGLAPMAMGELDTLADLVEARRFNDPVTADAVKCLREMHAQLGQLLEAVDRGQMTREAVEALERNRARFLQLIWDGAKTALVAPAMTVGVVHLLCALTGVPLDSTMVSTVFGTLVGADVLKSFGKVSSLAGAAS